MEISRDIRQLNEIGKRTPLAEGDDSLVDKFATDKFEMAAKEYHLLAQDLGLELTKEIIQNYYADTEKAQSLLESNSNPLNQFIELGTNRFPINYKIVPQGGMMLDGELDHDGNPYPLVVGQKFIRGQNILGWNSSSDTEGRHGDQSSLINVDAESQLSNCFRKLVTHLNTELDVYFSNADVNMKAFMNKDGTEINAYITDLASSLKQYFAKSPRLKNLRDKYPEQSKNI